MSDYNNNDAKKKQKKILIISGIVLLGFFILILVMTKKSPNAANHSNDAAKAEVVKVNTTVSENISDTEVLANKTQLDMKDLRDHVNDLSSKLQAQAQLESMNRAQDRKENQQTLAKILSEIDDIKSAPPPSLMSMSDLPKSNKPVGLPDGESMPPEEPELTSITIKGGGESSPSSNNTGKGNNEAQNTANNQKIKFTQTYLPVSFVKAKTVTSIDAPCGGTAQDNPFPILLNVTDNAQLPNSFRTKLKGCFVLSSGYGDVASERAYFRTEKMSCVTKKGEVIDMKVDGYIVGEDGKAGLRGKLVSKAGSKVALALLSGTVGGLGQAFASMATTLQQTPIGPTQIVTPSQSIGYAGATGVSQGFQQLSQYYINMAEKTFPVIEITDQRNVTVVFTGGVELPVNMNSSLDGSNKSLPINVN